MKIKLLKLATIIFFFSITSCKVVQNNYCTTTEKIFNLHEGMFINEVTTSLGVDPKDVYSIIENQTKVVLYLYKREYQSVDRKYVDEEVSLRGGPKRYKDEASLYVVFDAKTNKLLYYITDQGRSNASKTINTAIKMRILSAQK
ncbi:MAG: hypothetical protein WCR21_11065 [Bacteroidota bacterium]